MEYNYSKWNNYEIGKIGFVNKRKGHLSKLAYIDYVVKSDIKSVLEIGPGEAIEAQEIRKQREDINYIMLDVSELFLEHARKLGFRTVKGEMHKRTKFRHKLFDLVYLSSVIEHSPNVVDTIVELSRVSKRFYITMFKWRNKGGDLKSVYSDKGKCFTTMFNIHKLLELIAAYGTIEDLTVHTLHGESIDFRKYMEKFGRLDKHRNGNYLSIVGGF
jgi:hypothetical protein